MLAHFPSGFVLPNQALQLWQQLASKLRALVSDTELQKQKIGLAFRCGLKHNLGCDSRSQDSPRDIKGRCTRLRAVLSAEFFLPRGRDGLRVQPNDGGSFDIFTGKFRLGSIKPVQLLGADHDGWQSARFRRIAQSQTEDTTTAIEWRSPSMPNDPRLAAAIEAGAKSFHDEVREKKYLTWDTSSEKYRDETRAIVRPAVEAALRAVEAFDKRKAAKAMRARGKAAANAERAKELAIGTLREHLAGVDVPHDEKVARKRKLVMPPATEKIRRGTMTNTNAEKPIYVDASRRATLRSSGVSQEFMTLQEAVLEWHRMPEATKQRATIKTWGDDGQLYKPEHIGRLHYRPEPTR